MAETFELIWGGDVNLGRRQHHRLATLGLEAILDIPRLAAADLRLFNLECVVSNLGEQGRDKGEGGPFYFRARPEMVSILRQAGCDVVACANNHSGDYGAEALLDQRRWLEAAGIASVGIGATSQEAFRPLFRRVGERVLAIFCVDATQASFAATPERPGNAWLPLSQPERWSETFTPLIARAREVADHVVVAVHWGANDVDAPDAAEIEVGHRLIEAGADAVLGASAHRLQGVELHLGRPIIHDAGNLLFDAFTDRARPKGADGGLFALTFGAAGVEALRFIPLTIGYGQSRQCTGDEAREVTARYGAKCAALGTALQIDAEGHGVLALTPAPVHASRALPEGIEVDQVPLDARITPVQLGALRLVGLRISPQRMLRRQMLWVESFWSCDSPPEHDWRIGFQARPVVASSMPAWGRAMDHDPCDWRLPTRQWQPGRIYRDLYGLRPPPMRQMENVELRLHAQVHGPQGLVAEAGLPHLALPVLKAKGVPRLATSDTTYHVAAMPQVPRAEARPGQTWTAAELAEVTRGTWIVPPPDGWSVRSVVNGARHLDLRPGPHLYVAHDTWDRVRHENNAPGTNIDRHLQLPELSARIAGAIVARPMGTDLAALPQLLVPDPIRAIIELGLAARQRFGGEVFGVTGTVGKSTVSSMLQQMLGGPEEVLASIDNYNTRVGAPVQLASLGAEYRAAVIEMAQSGLWMKRGPISRQIRPSVAIVTALGMSQTAKGMRSLADVAKWKAKVFDGLSGRAVAVVGGHLPALDVVLSEARLHARDIFTYGTQADARLRVTEIAPSAVGSRVELSWQGRALRFDLPAFGTGMAMNAVSALACALAAEGDAEAAIEGLRAWRNEPARLERFTVTGPHGAFEVIDDSWNAEVISMEHALEVMASRPLPPSGRRIAVLGRIVHLGEMSRKLHEGLEGPVLASGADLVLTHGEEMLWLREKLPAALLGPHFSTAGELAGYLLGIARPGDTVMVKGSRRDSDFGKICPILREMTVLQREA